MFQKVNAVGLSAMSTTVLPRCTAEMPEGVPVMTTVPLDPLRAEIEEEPETVGVPEGTPDTTVSVRCPGFA